MRGLTDVQFADLIDEIACAMRFDTPIVDAMRRLHQRQLGRIGVVAGRVADQLERGISVGDAISGIASPVATQVSAAIGSVQTTGNVTLLERLAAQLRHRHHIAGSVRLGYFYPLVLATVAYVSLVMVAAPLVRDHQSRDLAWSPWLTSTLAWLQANVLIIPTLGLGLAVVMYIAFQFRHPLPRHDRISLFCHGLADQIDAGVPEGDAIRHASTVAGYPAAMPVEEPTLSMPAIAHLLRQASIEPSSWNRSGEANGKDVNEEAMTDESPNLLSAQLRFLGHHHAEVARRSDYIWTRLMPRLTMIVVGSGFVLGYAWFIIAPVYQQVARW